MRVAQIQQRLLQLPGPSFIREAYREWLNREPNRAELRDWRQQRLHKAAKGTILYQLCQSDKVKSVLTADHPQWTSDTAGSQTAGLPTGGPSVGGGQTIKILHQLFQEPDEAFVGGLYRELLGRESTAGERLGYCHMLAGGEERWSVFEMIALSPEAQSLWQQSASGWRVADLLSRAFRLNGVAFLAALTRELLARAPLRAEMRRWGRIGVSVEGRERVLAGLLYSSAFRRAVVLRRMPGGRVASGRAIHGLRRLYRHQGAQFVTHMYEELLGRAPDAQGLTLHAQRLPQIGKLDMIRSILLSPEAKAYRANPEGVAAALGDPLQDPTGPEAAAADRSYDVSVIIPTVKQITLVQQCVQSLRATTQDVSLEIIVIDDGSNPAIQNSLLTWGEEADVKVLWNTKSQGFSKTVNRGIRAASGRYILLVNNDVVFHELQTVRKMIDTMNAAPNIGIVGARLLFPNGQIQHAGIYELPGGIFGHRYIHAPADHLPAQVTDDVIAVTGALMLIRREVTAQIGLLSEDYYLAFEDVDYCYQARQAGWRVVYCGEAAAIHLQGATRAKNDDPDYQTYVQAEHDSWATFHNRWWEVDVSPFRGKRVIYVLNATGVSGGIKVVFEHMNRLHKLGYAVELYALQPPPSWFPVDIPVHVFANYGEMLPALRAQNAYKIATWWETAAIVHASCDRAQGGQGVPFHLVQDLEDSYYPNQPDEQARVRQTYHLDGMNYLATGQWVQRELLNQHGQQAARLSLSVDHDIFHPRPDAEHNPRRILAISRSKQHLKGFGLTVQAIQQVKQILPDIQVMTFGVEPPDIPGVSVEHISLPTDDKVAELYSKCGVFVQTSNHEGFGLPMLEAMACGTPVVTTRADGNEEFCVDGDNCVLVHRGDPGAVAAGIIKVLIDPGFAKSIADNGRRTAERYSWDHVMFNLNNEFAKDSLS